MLLPRGAGQYFESAREEADCPSLSATLDPLRIVRVTRSLVSGRVGLLMSTITPTVNTTTTTTTTTTADMTAIILSEAGTSRSEKERDLQLDS